MEGVAVTNQLVGLIASIGIAPTIVICALIIFFVIREMKKENSSTRKSISELMERSDSKDRSISTDVEDVRKQLQSIQKEYVTKEQHYRDLEGWKSEIGELRSAVANLPLEIIKIIKNIKE
ncbi:MAG: hypothetical protein HDR37_07905 [Treponema sp.]|nr:hypothetical protein [Treponema sp.]